MNTHAIRVREQQFVDANGYRDTQGQAHFPDKKLQIDELDKMPRKRGR